MHFEGIFSADAQIKAADDGLVVRRGMEPLRELTSVGPGSKDAVARRREGARLTGASVPVAIAIAVWP